MAELNHFHSYTAYGLGIRSELALPELVAEERPAEVTVRLGTVEPLPTEGSKPYSCLRPSSHETRLHWQDAGRFLIRGGQEVVVEPVSGVEERVLRLYVLGPSLAILLHQRGRLVLHASAVEVDGGAVAFLGGAGWGKSTTAAALNARGYALVADDVIAIGPDGNGRPTLYSGFPQIKLWPEVAATLGVEPEEMALLHPKLEKRAHRSIRKFSTQPLPLKRLYVLEDGESLEVEPLKPQDALVELVRHSWCARVLREQETEEHFLQCVNLVKTIPVRRLTKPRSLPKLSELVRFVVDDAINGD